jgi:hypothetical protein
MTKLALAITIIAGIYLSGCTSLQQKPYSAAPEGVSISKAPNGSYSVDRVKIQRSAKPASGDALQFCFAQNLPGISGTPLLNSAKTKITAQGKDQVSFVVPMTMGTPLSYEIMFTLTVSDTSGTRLFDYSNIKIRGTWTANEAPLPGSQEAAMYVDSAFDKLRMISETLTSCLDTEG